MSSWVEDFEKEHIKSIKRMMSRLYELSSPIKYEVMEEIENKIEKTKEEKIIEWYKDNKGCTFQLIMDKWEVSELYAKTLLTRVTKLKV